MTGVQTCALPIYCGGDQDLISPVTVGQHLQHIFKKSELYVIQCGEHDFAEQYADEVAIYINAFIKQF